MRQENIEADVVVVGGGMAGVNAAIAAARLGSRVVLVQNRPVLGGNSSSEVRVWVCGATATGHQRFARETGIMGELYLENQYTNPEGNPYYWDLVVLEAVRAEPNIDLYLNTDVHAVQVSEGRIRSVSARTIGSEREYVFTAPLFADCTGDGLVGALAGAEHLLGREARSSYQEDWAPELADDLTLGSTLLFYTKDAGVPVPFVPPSFAIDIASTSIPERRVIRTGDNGADYWWIEWGGELDVVADNERIRDELWAVIYGIWDYIKNSGRFDAETLTLEWVGSVPGKREYRRFIGDTVVRQQDITPHHAVTDAVAFGGWSIDLHPSKGVYDDGGAAQQLYPDGTYDIPYRALYSRNVENLFVAGRNISASHVAFGSMRVMATCGVMGEAVGTAAAFARSRGLSPRDVGRSHFQEYQQTLLRQDAALIGVRHDDPLDAAPAGRVSASSTLTAFPETSHAEAVPLSSAAGLLLPWAPELTTLGVCLRAAAATTLRWSLHATDHPRVYTPGRELVSGQVRVPAGEQVWVDLDLGPDLAGEGDVVLVLHPAADVAWWTGAEYLFGLVSMQRRSGGTAEIDAHVADGPNSVVEWDIKKLRRRTFAVRNTAPLTAYGACNAVGGYARPYGGPNLWSSDRLADGTEEWLAVEWDEATPVGEVVLVFNDDVNEYLINLHYHRTPFRVMPELVRDYRIEVREGSGPWCEVAAVADNRRRRRSHRLDGRPLTGVRVVVSATNGSPWVQIVQLRTHVTGAAHGQG